MDIKSKSNNSKFIISVVIGVILLALSIGMVASYPLIEDIANKNKQSTFEQYDFSDICNSSYGIYSEIVNKREKKKVNPSEYLTNTEDIKELEDSSISEIKTRIDDRIKSDLDDLNRHLRNLEYYGIDKTSNIAESYTSGNIYALLRSDITKSTIEDLQNKYSFYVVLDYDSKGRVTVLNSYRANTNVLSIITSSSNMEESYPYMNKITNAKFVYAIPKDLKYTDNISSYIESAQSYAYADASDIFTNIALVIILILAIAIPYRISKEFIGFKLISRIPFEINLLGLILLFVFIVDSKFSIMVRDTLTGNIDIYIGSALEKYNDLLVKGMNILYWFVIFAVVFLAIVYLKHILNTGIKDYLKGKSLIYKNLTFIKRCFNKFLDYVTKVDFKKKNTKKLVLALGLNLLVIMIMCGIWFFGMFLAIIYTIILFVYITKKLDSISSKYNKLLDATNKIAEGNLDVKVKEDIGVFEPLKEELEKIQSGFKNAVNEEVKSQKMKTELISNVSHDLKTPLTSIITYVDLLKDENLSEEKRRLYLETLDKKSQRLKDLIEDLFEMSKVSSGNINLNIENVDIVSLMKQTILELSDKIDESKLKIKTNFPDNKVILPLDSQRMFRVLENLIINITKYSLEGTRVYIDIKDYNDKAEITLKNIAKSELDFSEEDIVERFARGDKSRNTEGSGLGLSIAKSFVELQGGKFNINVDGDLFKVIITFNK